LGRLHVQRSHTSVVTGWPAWSIICCVFRSGDGTKRTLLETH
jgi:hypothetical protein